MVITETDYKLTEQRAQDLREHGHAIAARYDRRRSRVVVRLNTGVELAFPPKLAQGLAGAEPDDLARIEISPSGLGLHWPTLDADLYIPGRLLARLATIVGCRHNSAPQAAACAPRPRRVAPAKTGD